MLISNKEAQRPALLTQADADLLGVEGARAVDGYLRATGGDIATPLHRLPGQAALLGIANLYVKDEGYRLGLESFKALGGAYAVVRLALEQAGDLLDRRLAFEDLEDEGVGEALRSMTFGCATDGNHGRSVAAGARMIGATSKIFVHSGVSEGRKAAIARFGAEIVTVPGTYDDSVEEAARQCEANDWTLVSDTSWPGYERVPGLVMQGYTRIVQEVLGEIEGHPTHIFVQAGVGGLAAAVAGHLALLLGAERPHIVVVEPDRAACLYQSCLRGDRQKVAHGQPTVMAMLECYEPSLAAWRILRSTADAFMTVSDAEAIGTMRLLARPVEGDPVIVSGESGGAGLAGLRQVAADPSARSAIGLNARSRVLVINTEGATDVARFCELVGLDPTGLQPTA